MRLSFFGAAGEVTGSCYLLETPRARVLIDFGLHQGGKESVRRNLRFPPLDASRLDAVVLTHAHLDHSGRLPLLPRHGFGGPIHATPATIDLCGILLRDSAHIQQTDTERLSRRRLREGKPAVLPLYGPGDVDAALALLRALPYEKALEVAPGITVRFVDAGHILGSASVEVTVREPNGAQRVLAFSGDLGPSGAPLLRDPTPLRHADTVILESTYGDRDHRPLGATIEELAGILATARAPSGGKVLIPAFAVGRTQQLIYHLGRLCYAGRLSNTGPGATPGPVVIDSPMAIETTELYRRHRELFDADAWAIINDGRTPLAFPGLRYARSGEQSRALNGLGAGAVIIAGSGMCNGGRILHHLRHNLWRPEVHLIIVGFQAVGTLGRRIVDGAAQIQIMGEPIAVKAHVHTLGGLSAHTGQSGLMAWARNFDPRPARLILTHGEPAARDVLHAKLTLDLGVNVLRPLWGETIEV